ncbi:MAG: hypothetical protein QOJ29_961 [Thermoleophilaceae bacterium]|jgi:hypothetical protein|nr:hypothetical protein [Thermoleophilaceae bacterium]
MTLCLLTSDGRHTTMGERIAALAEHLDATVVVTGTADWDGATHIDALSGTFEAAVAFGWQACLHVFRPQADKYAYVVPALEDTQMWHGDERRMLAALTYDLPLTLIAPNEPMAAALKMARSAQKVTVSRGGLPPFTDVSFTSERGQTPLSGMRVFGIGAVEDVFARTGTGVVRADRLDNADVVLEVALPGGPLAIAPRAMQRGVVPVVTPVEDDLVVDGESGLIVGFDDVPGTARALDTLAGDSELLGRLRDGALARAVALPTPADEATALKKILADAPSATDRPERLLLNARAAMEPIAQERRALDQALRSHEDRIAALTAETENLRAALEEARRSLLNRVRSRL